MKFKNISKTIKAVIFFVITIGTNETKSQEIIKQEKIIVEKDSIDFLYISNNDNKPKPILLFLQGSLCYPLFLENNGISKVNLPFDFTNFLTKVNIVLIKRKGCPMSYDRKKIDFLVNNPPNEFKKFDNLNYRVFQANEVINYLKQNQNTQEIYVVGHSEGYRVASKLSEINQNINKMICLSSNPFSRSVENILLKSTENYLYENDASRINQIEDEYFYNYLVNEDSSKDENYYSYNKHLPLDSFKKFKKPLLIAFGSNDLSSSLNLFLPFILVDQQNITVKSYPDLGHNFEKKTINKNDSAQTTYFWDAVFEDCVRWLLEN